MRVAAEVHVTQHSRLPQAMENGEILITLASSVELEQHEQMPGGLFLGSGEWRGGLVVQVQGGNLVHHWGICTRDSNSHFTPILDGL